jgi:CBS domain-containing protein
MRTIEGLHRSGVAIAPEQTLRKAAEVMNAAGVGCLAVVDGERLVGIVTDRDLVRRGLARGMSPDARVDATMSSPVLTVAAEADGRDAIRMFRMHGVRRLAVVRGAHFVGMLTIDDLLVGLAKDLGDLTSPIASEISSPDQDAPAPAVR